MLPPISSKDSPLLNLRTTSSRIAKQAPSVPMYHDDVLMYCHTDAFESRGRNLQLLREALGIQDITFFPSKIKMIMGIEDEAMVNMYNALDVYLQPSKGEGFGIPIIEAQACGVPVIVTNWTAMPELLGGGWLLKDITPEWTMQHSWEAAANVNEIVEYLEEAYKMKKSGELAGLKIKAREKALLYDEAVVFKDYWMPILEDIENNLKPNAPNRAERRRKAKALAKGGRNESTKNNKS